MHRSLYLVCYDIAAPQRWRQVHRLLRAYRVEGQKSVFECLFTATELRDVVRQLRTLIDPAADRVHIVRLDPRMSCEGWGTAQLYARGRALTVL